MEATSSALGLIVIVILYIAIGAKMDRCTCRNYFLARSKSRYFSGCFLFQSPDFIWPSLLTSEIGMRGH